MIATAAELAARKDVIAASPDLLAMRTRLEAALAPFLGRPVYVPARKALLSRWGSLCRDCRGEIGFDPSSPDVQRCPGCGRNWSTEQTQRWWIYWYQLWLAERVLQCSLLSALGGDARCGPKAAEALGAIAARYLEYPNADNVLGPSRPFFSTYLESIWVLQLATAAEVLKQGGHLPRSLAADLEAKLFRPSAALIADYDEGRSNRQVWNAAALFGLGVTLGDDGLRQRAAHDPSGILASLDSGLLADGLWYEGENYHWFALRGLVWGVELLRAGGEADLWSEDSPLGGKLRAAFRAPVLTALPDFTFPARRDSKFGVSLRQRRMAELWELSYAAAQRREQRPPERDEIGSLLRFIYDPAVPEGGDPAREITEVERAAPPSGVRREALGWKGLLWAPPVLQAARPDLWRPGTAHLEATGLAIFRRDEGRTYLSLDYGESGGGHGHPDRLNLTYVANGTPWLLDFGTGSYLTPSLGWYRSSLAHNAPYLDNASQAPARGYCVGYDEQDAAAWVCAQLPEHSAFEGATIQRTIVVRPEYVLDVLQMGSTAGERALVLPWHGLGEVAVDELGLTFTRPDGRLRVLLAARQPFQVQVAEGYGPPVHGGDAERRRFAVVMANGEELTLAACLATSDEVEELECVEDQFLVRLTGDRLHFHNACDDGWMIQLERGDPIVLGGLRDLPEEALALATPRAAPATESVFNPLAGARTLTTAAAARSIATAVRPPLDGSFEGFDRSAPLDLAHEDQFRRAEQPWDGAERFSATAWLNHDDEHVYIAIDVTAPEPAFRASGAPDPELDNENPDINGDGVQVYVATSFFYGWVVVPDTEDSHKVRATPVAGTDAEANMVRGGWSETERGYRLTLALSLPDAAEGFGFDLLVNRGQAGRERRVGQLVWSGAKGERLYLAGDRPMRHELPWVAVT